MNAVVKFLAPLALLGAMVVTAAMPVMAQGPNAPINSRLHDQNARIRQGVHHDTLNRYQAHQLHAADARIHRSEHRDRMAHGGRLTAAEHRNLEHRLNSDSHRIYREKHNIH